MNNNFCLSQVHTPSLSTASGATKTCFPPKAYFHGGYFRRGWGFTGYRCIYTVCLILGLGFGLSNIAHAASDPNQPKAPVFEVTALTPPSEGVGISPDPNNLSGTGIFATGTNTGTNAGTSGSNSKAANILDSIVQSANMLNNDPNNLPPAKPYLGGADFTGGYALTVLQKIIPYWEPPAGSHTIQFSLRIGSDGRTLFCEPKTHSGNQQLDQSGCAAALKAGSFGVPPYGAVSEIFLSLATDALALKNQNTGANKGIGTSANIPIAAGSNNSTGSNKPASNAPVVDMALGNMPPLVKQQVAPAQRAVADPNLGYAEQVVRNARPYLVVPPGLNGSFTTEISLQVSPAGMISSLNISKPSGNKAADDAVLNAIRTPGILPLPGASPKTLRLTFTLTGN